MRRLLPWVVTVLALLTLAMVYYGYRDRSLQLAALQGRADQLERQSAERVRELKAKLAVAEKAQAMAERRFAEVKASAQATVNASPRAAGPMIDSNDMRKDPAYAGLWRKQQLRNIMRQYADAFAVLKLPAEQMAKLKDLLLARNDATQVAREAGQEAGLTGRDLNLAVRDASNAVNDEIKGLIGPDAFTQLQNTPSTSAFKMMIENTVGVDLSGAGTPLTPDQVTSLASIYGSGMRNPNPGTPGWQVPDPQTGLAPADQAMLDKAAQTLSPAQVPIVRDYLLEQRQQQQYFQKQAAARQAAGGG